MGLQGFGGEEEVTYDDDTSGNVSRCICGTEGLRADDVADAVGD